MKTGAELIAVERERHVAEEGWTPEHDDRHTNDELARAAACYAAPEPVFVQRNRSDGGIALVSPWPRYWVSNPAGRGEGWYSWKRSESDRLTHLVRAGALIAAEIDRLQRATELKGEGR